MSNEDRQTAEPPRIGTAEPIEAPPETDEQASAVAPPVAAVTAAAKAVAPQPEADKPAPYFNVDGMAQTYRKSDRGHYIFVPIQSSVLRPDSASRLADDLSAVTFYPVKKGDLPTRPAELAVLCRVDAACVTHVLSIALDADAYTTLPRVPGVLLGVRLKCSDGYVSVLAVDAGGAIFPVAMVVEL